MTQVSLLVPKYFMWIYELKKLRLEMGFSWQLLPGVHRASTNKVLYLEAGEPKIQAQFQPNRKVESQPRPKPRLKSQVLTQYGGGSGFYPQ